MTFWNDPKSLVPKQQHRWVISFSQKELNQTSLKDGDGFIPKWFAKSVDKPSYEIKNVQAKYLFSHTFNFPTRPIWKPITITFYDIILKEGRISYFNKPIIKDNEIVEKDNQEDFRQRYSTQAFFYKFLQDSGYFSPEELEEPDFLVRMRKYNFKKDMIDAFTGRPQSLYNRDFIYSNGKKLNNSTLNWTTLDISELLPDGEIVETWKLYNALISDVKFDKLDYSSDNILTVTVTVNYDWAELVGDRNIRYDDDLVSFIPENFKDKLMDSFGVSSTLNFPKITIKTPEIPAQERLKRGEAVPLTSINPAIETTISLSNPKTPSGPPPISTEIAGSPSYRAPPTPNLEGAFTGPAAPNTFSGQAATVNEVATTAQNKKFIGEITGLAVPNRPSPTTKQLSPTVSSYSSEDQSPNSQGNPARGSTLPKID